MQDIGTTLLSTIALYVLVVLFIRLSGKRSTSQMNNFDWIVTVAMGSLMATGILSETVPMTEAAAAIALLLALQWLLTKVIVHFPAVGRVVRARPALLYHEGEFQDEAMARERVSKYEILQAIRGDGYADLKEVQSVILEADASMSVLRRDEETPEDPAVRDVENISADWVD